jgi:Asp-tRNA(Asn)/Glu-tRNA(Gln) amidotransferase A subunit family amidase
MGAFRAASAIRGGEITSERLVSACIARIGEREPLVRAFVDLQPEQALARARELDRRRPEAHEHLYGVPVAVKEAFDVEGFHCGWGTRIHTGRVASKDAAVVARLKAAGAVIIGTAVSTEYAIAAAGPTTNPHDPRRSPGGSSSGSAAAVASEMVPLALGSQSIGSIVRPSIYCGVLGLKPTRGAISTRGCMPLAQELDHVGPIARHVEDIALACRVAFGYDPLDPVSVEVTPPDLDTAPPITNVLQVTGPLRDRVQEASSEAIQRATAAFRRSGVPVKTVDLPEDFDRIEDCIFTLLCRGIAAHHGADYDRHAELMSQRMRELVVRGRNIDSAEHAAAIDYARDLTNTLMQLLEPGTVIVNIATDGIAPALAEGTGSPLLQGLWTVTGLPALAVPCGAAGGMPIGIQLAAAPGQESLLLSAGKVLQQNLRADEQNGSGRKKYSRFPTMRPKGKATRS